MRGEQGLNGCRNDQSLRHFLRAAQVGTLRLEKASSAAISQLFSKRPAVSQGYLRKNTFSM
jgi:hypothetical protein